MKRKWKVLAALAVLASAATIAAVVYVKTHPLVFNESMWEHAHCIKIAAFSLQDYATAHNGQFPTHPGGYGDALLLLDEGVYHTLTGAGFDEAAFHEAKRKGEHLPEEKCGRVYIQGLKIGMDPNIVILYDKIPTPGGDHCHFPHRLLAAPAREACCIDGMMRFVRESDWPQFAAEQVELLVENGFERDKARRLWGLEIAEK
jgi:hypothetical protein